MMPDPETAADLPARGADEPEDTWRGRAAAALLVRARACRWFARTFARHAAQDWTTAATAAHAGYAGSEWRAAHREIAEAHDLERRAAELVGLVRS